MCFLFTIGYHDSIDAPFRRYRYQSPEWKKGTAYVRAIWAASTASWPAMQEGQAFRPAGGYIGERQGIQIAAIDVCATMGRPVRFQKTWSGLIPLLEGADRNLLLEQRSSSSRGEATLTHLALGTQEAICCRCTHGEQLPAALLSEVKMLMPLKRFDEGGEKRDEPFCADAVGGMPDQESMCCTSGP